MTGGTISYNVGTTDFVSTAGVALTGGSIFTMNGGTISYNESKGIAGSGGVMVNGDSVMIMNGGSIHHNKTATSGGGVMVNANRITTFTMNGGTLTDNDALEGGGVSVGGVGGTNGITDIPTFTMKGGTITGNTATDRGGGVYVAPHAIFTKGLPDSSAASGVIYGYDPDNPNSNKVRTGTSFGILDNMGHAVYVEAGPKKRETTVMPYQRLDSTVAGASGGWGE
jgi:hypothetical protein